MSYKVEEGTILSKGENVIIGHGTVIGAIPLMFKKGTHDLKFDGTRKVVIEDDVAIGNNVTIMGGHYGETIIKKGAKIWDGSIIGHDCIIGEYTAMVTNVTINGEVNVGKWCMIGSGVTIKPKINIGNFVQIGVGAVVLGDVPDRAVIVGGQDPPRVIRVNEWNPKNLES